MLLRRYKAIPILLLALALPVAGCGSSSEFETPAHPALQMQKEERVREELCEYPRSMAEARGKDALETYVIACE